MATPALGRPNRWGMWLILWIVAAFVYYIMNDVSWWVSVVSTLMVVGCCFALYKLWPFARFRALAAALITFVALFLVLCVGVLDFLPGLKTVRKTYTRMMDQGEIRFVQLCTSTGTRAERSDFASIERDEVKLTAQYQNELAAADQIADDQQRERAKNLVRVKFSPKFDQIKDRRKSLDLAPANIGMVPQNWQLEDWIYLLSFIFPVILWAMLILWTITAVSFGGGYVAHVGGVGVHTSHDSRLKKFAGGFLWFILIVVFPLSLGLLIFAFSRGGVLLDKMTASGETGPRSGQVQASTSGARHVPPARPSRVSNQITEPATLNGWKEVARGQVDVRQPWTNVPSYATRIMVMTWGQAVIDPTFGANDPNGSTESAWEGSGFTLPGYNRHAAVYQLDGAIHPLGTQTEIILGDSESFSIGPNEVPSGFVDNRGIWHYKILVST